MARNVLVGVDIGGTFTDLVVGAEGEERVHKVKTLTTPHDPVEGVMTALREGLSLIGAQPADVARFVHATTLTTNLVLEKKGARVAYVTTQGFGDIFALGKGYPSGIEMFDLMYIRPPNFVPREMVFELSERMAASGTPLTPLTREAAERAAREIAASKPEAVAVCLLHAYKNDAHEAAFGEVLREYLPDTYIALSSRIWPEISEYERGATTLVSAYVGPTLAHYLERLEASLRAEGLACPVHIMQSSGGIMAAADAASRAVYTLESGPAAGVVSAGRLGNDCGYPNIISFDMGGTTAKAGLVEKGKPRITHDFWVGGNTSSEAKGGGEPIRLPIIDLAEVGAGGGSIASVDPGGFLRVGPRSAGASPGPACYGLGGELPTVTDANLVLGYLDPDFFVGGRMTLDYDRAVRAIRQNVGDPLKLGDAEAAWRIYELANAAMGSAVRMVTIYRGVDPRHHVLTAFGGAGPLHAVRVAEEFGISRVLVPPLPGVRSAFGLLESDLRYDFVNAAQTPTAEPDLALLEATFAALEDRARAYTAVPNLTLGRQLEIRFAHQSLRLKVDIPEGPITAKVIAAAEAQYRLDYYSMCAISPSDSCIIVNCWIEASSGVRKPGLTPPDVAEADDSAERARKGERRAFFPETDFVATPVYDRVLLRAGDTLAGPALVEEAESTTVLPPGHSLHVDAYGNLLIELGF
jgi:N-methylhydantoinase A